MVTTSTLVEPASKCRCVNNAGGGGFCSAAALLTAATNRTEEEPEQEEERVLISPASATVADISVSVPMTVVGWPYYSHLHATPPSCGTVVRLVRQPENVHDQNAIAAFVVLLGKNDDKSSRQPIGYIPKNVAARLAPLLDKKELVFTQASVSKCFGASIRLEVVMGRTSSSRACEEMLDALRPPSNIAKADVERANKASYSLEGMPYLPWEPMHHDWKGGTFPPCWRGEEQHGLPPPFDSTKCCSTPPLTVQDVKTQQSVSSSWPPSDTILQRLGLAPANDAVWWQEVAGLRPPIEWHVTGGVDVTPHVSMSQTQTKKTSEMLSGAIHGVTNVWHLDMLENMQQVMNAPNFWEQRSRDAFIRSFGGPYVLGQAEEKLTLIHGAPHTELTDKICIAHNLVYTAIHLTPPPSPGYNTIIFGCNRRGAGFHYHQHLIGEIQAKSAPMVPHQPVVTSVFYFEPEHDSGKEVVLWRPILNFPFEIAEYQAVRALSTSHGMIHVQRAGLQKMAVHGILHAPQNREERRGCRVAITARITKPNAEKLVQPYIQRGSYCTELGPNGDKQLNSEE